MSILKYLGYKLPSDIFMVVSAVLYGEIFLASGMFINEASIFFVVTLNAMRLLNYKRRG
ncbi:hypothetical protein [Thermoanaerobacterium sp. RBIITD]|uniref:hypothetical protein n=1 Tax=Thermoanaerobacterium sp. RBIITD TaxID=1550240 RepID=UPI0012FE1794|nr:hypothetical protein [Thermoanaerobacterium sp. RBIITD]